MEYFMLVDYISVEKLPWIVVWVDWNFYAYWESLLLSCAFFVAHYWLNVSHHSISGISLGLFIGFCVWNVICAIRYGYAVG